MDTRQLEALQGRLPKIPGILGRGEYFNSVVLIPLMWSEGEYHFIFQKRNSGIRQGGEICFPGGMHDPGEDNTLEETAVRETYEEMGIARDKIKILGAVDTMVTPMGVMVDAFLGILYIKSLDELRLNKDEVDYAFSVPVSYFETHEPDKYQARVMVEPSYKDKDGREVVLFPSKELDIPAVYRKPWGGRMYKILVYKVKGETIWGITAKFIYHVVSMLREKG